MDYEALKKELESLSDEDLMRLFKDIMPALCKRLMKDRSFMQDMMPSCMEMMGGIFEKPKI